ncbi:hypothetical protein WICPIJ_010040 [Wickerhamomyces pijperi]|uniref:Secreted protein n=1 Tax=Wickerhamomyces pijperi TaxID=599730 RepID=A0A9P8PI38_WICPI|nr:hypothetical protein WICPIJ_010040 [Wickerhamomyces pijperi]
MIQIYLILAHCLLTITATITTSTLQQRELFVLPEADSHFVDSHYTLDYDTSSICSTTNFAGSLDQVSSYQGGLILEESEDDSVNYRFWAMVNSNYNLSEVLYYYDSPLNNTDVTSYRSIKTDQLGVVNFKVTNLTSKNCDDGSYTSLIFHYVDTKNVSHYYIFGLGDNFNQHVSIVTSQLTDFIPANVYSVNIDYSCDAVAEALSSGSCTKSLSLLETLTPGMATVVQHTATASIITLSSESSSQPVTTLTVSPTISSYTSSGTTLLAPVAKTITLAPDVIKAQDDSDDTTAESTTVVSPPAWDTQDLPHLHFSIPPVESFISASDPPSSSHSSTHVSSSSSSPSSLPHYVTSQLSGKNSTNHNTTTHNLSSNAITNITIPAFDPKLQGNLHPNRTLASFGLDIPYVMLGSFTQLTLNFTFNSHFVNSTNIATIFDTQSVVNHPRYGDRWFALDISRQFTDALDVSFDVFPFDLAKFNGDFGVTAVVSVNQSFVEDKAGSLKKRSDSVLSYEIVASVNEPISSATGDLSFIRIDKATVNTSNTSLAQVWEGSAIKLRNESLWTWVLPLLSVVWVLC